ncbi:MAG TPA: UDP-N-acetylmuramoyl-L-alanyl-D-glutamate--2,6-diaminopimelate ligase [Baekduia sp.]|uniref:UDP-N-acetylmuramoyl-L-alanyl-D-glutamate--2, 6-diaminopimelate ligase n=1 Tax=Baekduia sp. TaxID=2600305 RepID=UPI002D766981|nr:UDP-N-acetylmuramoyl-L-alanyl-D-glutamate--2,6-diaminopimelate ligase [Baekduia sp.]HET6505545.1 UDP-N-acetylmuramoyl-L-alanyl-D-glutamate--2,6-diaminopimelate ligase [Baekduia sp.]
MLLGDLFEDGALPDVDVTALHYDARAVTPGSVFFCVRGFTADGHRYAPDAVANGAVALVVDHPLDLEVPEVRVDDVRAAMAPAAARLHGDPTAALAMVGITGTNGKTTTSFLTRTVLEAGGRSTGLVGTVTSWVAGVEHPVVRTTPEAIDLQRMFAAMRDGGDTAAVMEVSSHALSLGRADAIHWDVAAFTNLTQDHLDFHSDMEDYFLAKRKLFEVAGAQGATLIVNVDDEYGARLAQEFPQAIAIGIDAPGAVLRAVELDAGPASSDFTVDGVRFTAPLPGRFNVLNSLVAIAAARALGIDDATIAAALPGAGGVPGRFEPVAEGQGFAVIVDYAHKPDALDNVLRTARELAGDHRLIVVVGAGGDRDRGKRPMMGAAAAQHADVVVLTSDNPRSEDPEAIIDAIAAGAGDGALRIVDRREAIEHAIAQAGDGDVVVIAGKGHETYQEVAGGVKLPFDDREVAREALRARLDG